MKRRSTKRDHLRALACICRQFGGQLSIVAQSAYDALFYNRSRTPRLHEAPFTSAHGLHWNRKIVYIVHRREEVGSIIHEMGHVFAAAYPPEHRQCREWDWFGWEVAIARQIGAWCTWSRHNGNYATGEDGSRDWGKLSTKQRRAVIADRLKHAKKIGVLDAAGTPRSLR